MNVTNWVELFKQVGVDKETLNKWHHEFENKFPEDHQSFLEWLGLSPEEIKKIRSEA